MALRTRKPESVACHCDECEGVRAAAEHGAVHPVHLAVLDSHAQQRFNDLQSRRSVMEMPKGVIALGLLTLLIVLGWYSWRADGLIAGTAIGLCLLVNGWTMGTAWVRVEEREIRMRLEYEVSELRSKITGRSDDPSMEVCEAAKGVIDAAKIRQEDLDSDDDDFEYEVPQDVMMSLSDAISKWEGK